MFGKSRKRRRADLLLPLWCFALAGSPCVRAGGGDNLAELDQIESLESLESAGNLDGAIAVVRDALPAATGSRRGELLATVARLHVRLGQLDDAETIYRELLDPDGEVDGEFTAKHAAGWHFEFAAVLRAAGKFDEAGVHYAAAEKSSDSSGDLTRLEAIYWQAWLDHQAGRIAEGRQRADRLLKAMDAPEAAGGAVQSPRRIALKQYTLYLRSQLEIADHDDQSAGATLDELRRCSPRDPLLAQAEFWRGEIAYRCGDDELARELFGQVALRTAGLDDAWTALAPLRLAQLEAARQRWNDVLLALDWLEWRWPESPLEHEVNYLRGRALAGRGEFSAARDAYHRVLGDEDAQETETAAMAQWMIGETYFHQRVFAEARTAYQQVVDEHDVPEWQARAALQLGKCWELEGRWEEAAAVYADAAERFSRTAAARQLVARSKFVEQTIRK